MNRNSTKQRYLNIAAICALLVVFPSVSFADWKLMPDESYIGFATIKNDAIVESHSFERISGHVTSAGQAAIQIDLASVQTQIPIRNERIGSMLFNIAQFPKLEVLAGIDVMAITKMEQGATQSLDLTAKTTLHGMTANVKLPLIITRLAGDRFQVVTTKPVIIYGHQFGLGEGIEALQVIAKLSSITPAVPVTFSLIFGSD
ncbi:MAG: polyisoprenoid-binding protein YceI [Candidatus Azotimanducaceae bacterium]|jgi:polyisoprenoid-binding protein YceI